MSNSVGIFSLYQEALLGQFIYSYTTEFRPQGKRREKNKLHVVPLFSTQLDDSCSEESCIGVCITYLYTALWNATVQFTSCFLRI